MATLALTFVGAAIGNAIAPAAAGVAAGALTGASIGAFVGGSVGGIIDSYILFPALFPNKGAQGPRLDDLQIQNASEGSPMKLAFGPTNRIAGTLIWLSDRREHEHEVGGGKGGGSSGGTSYTYSQDIAVHIMDCTIRPIRRVLKIWADTKLIWDASTNPAVITTDSIYITSDNGKFASITIYRGTSTQAVDPLVNAGTEGGAPAYTYSAYAVVEDLQLGDYGNHIPSLTFLVQVEQEKSVGSAIRDICERAGLEPGQIDVTRVDGCLRGYTVAGPMEMNRVLEPLMLAYGVNVQEVDNQLVFFTMGYEPIIEVDESHLAAHEPGRGVPRKVEVTNNSALTLPSEVLVSFIEPDFDFKQGAQSEKRISVQTDVVIPLDFPIVFTSDEARTIAKRVLWSAWAESQDVTIDLPPSYAEIQEGDIIHFTADEEEYTVRVLEINRGVNRRINIRARTVEQEVYTQSAEGDAPGVDPQEPYVPPEITVWYMDGPALLADHVTQPGFYYGVTTTTPDAPWTGAAVYISRDGGTTYEFFGSIPQEAVLGTVSTPTTISDVPYWDVETELEVELISGSLSSVSELECLNGFNRIVVPNVLAPQYGYDNTEIIGFQFATHLGGTRYRLSRLLRNVRDTAALRPATAYNGTYAAILQQGPIRFGALGTSGANLAFKVKFVPTGGNLLTATVYDVGAGSAAGTMRCLAPVHVKGVRDGSNNTTISWVRVARAFFHIFSAQAPLLDDENPEVYEVDIMDNLTVRRTLTVTGATEVVYTAADQTTDGLSPGQQLKVRVYQISTISGRGHTKDSII